jgi:AcrR family transcriptional regulator
VAVKPPANYRQRQAQATRERIAIAARALFADRGYVSTTVEAIAGRAGVAVPTVYGAFGSKTGILAEIRRLWLQEAGVLPLVAEALAEPDYDRRLELAARWHRQQMETGYDVISIHKQAQLIDPAAAESRKKALGAREREIRKFIEALEPGLRSGLDVQAALDIWVALEHEGIYQELVLNRGWHADRYEHWLAATLKHQLLGSTAEPSSAEASGQP